MAQSTTNLGKIHVFPSESLYNQFKDIIADNDLALLKDDGAYIVAALLEQNGYVKFSNGLILQWGVTTSNSGTITFPLAHKSSVFAVTLFMEAHDTSTIHIYAQSISLDNFVITKAIPQSQFQSFAKAYWISLGV